MSNLHLRLLLLRHSSLWRRTSHQASAVATGVTGKERSTHTLSWSRQCTARKRVSMRPFNTDTIDTELDCEKDVLHLSDSCVQQILHVTEADEHRMLRVIVDGGGCSGFQYKFELDDKLQSDDKIFEHGGARVVIDALSLSFLAGSTVDYHRELIRSSFRIIGNPNAEQSCSCGVSFALK